MREVRGLLPSIPPTTSVAAAVLPCPHLFGEAVCSNKPQAPPSHTPRGLPHPRRLTRRSLHTCCHHPSSFYLVFYHAGSDVVGFGPLCQPGGSSIAAWRHRAHIDQSGRLMVVAGSVGPNQKASFSAGVREEEERRQNISFLAVSFGRQCR